MIHAHESSTLDQTDFKAFLAALDNPVQANAVLISRAFDHHSEQVERAYVIDENRIRDYGAYGTRYECRTKLIRKLPPYEIPNIACKAKALNGAAHSAVLSK